MHQPSPLLSDYIQNIVYYEGYSAEHSVDKLLPDGSIYVLIDMDSGAKKVYYNDEFTLHKEVHTSYVSGQHQGFLYIDARNSNMMVVSFKIGGAYPFFNFAISDINDRVEQLELYWGASVNEMRDQIIAEKNIDAKFRLMEDFLLARKIDRAEDNVSLEPAIDLLLNDPYQVTVKSLAEKVSVSQKHLIDLFHQRVGLAPKVLMRIFRFQKVIHMIEQKTKIDWTGIAHECGYYDQSHFIKDFYAFSGMKPSSYPDQKGEYINFLPMK